MLDVNVSLASPELTLQGTGPSSKHAPYLALIHKAVCFHQGELAQYFCLAAELHKKLRLALEDDNPIMETVRTRHLALTDFLNRNLYRIWDRTQEDLHHYFELSQRSKKPIRCCIKSTEVRDKNEYIVPVFRDASVRYDSSCQVQMNTGFRWIKETGRYFCCPDIPAWAKDRKYVNPRLNGEGVKLYRSPNFFARILYNDDQEWIKCWKQQGEETPNVLLDCYKSTLIIPMTLMNNQIDPEFQRITSIGQVGRTHFGFLCFDHQETRFFNERSDVEIGYIFADLLSLYFITRLVFVGLSTTYNKAVGMTAEAGA